MCSQSSSIQRTSQSGRKQDYHTAPPSDIKDLLEQFDDGVRLKELMQAVKRMMRYQTQTAQAQIEARQKRRQAGFRRRDVSTRDADFMKELQKLLAQGKLKGFEVLTERAGQCQHARDQLGPLEEEGIEAEQHLEGELWRLQQAQDSMMEKFREEIGFSENYSSGRSSGSASESSSQYDSEPELAGQLPPDEEIIGLIGVHEGDTSCWEQDVADWASDSGFGDLDRYPDLSAENGMVSSSVPPKPFPQAIFERYPRLINDFTTHRNRVTQWLLNTTLISRLEATVLKNQLDKENASAPSNWSQLVIAYFDKDAATTAQPDESSKLNPPNAENQQVISLTPKIKTLDPLKDTSDENLGTDGVLVTLPDLQYSENSSTNINRLSSSYGHGTSGSPEAELHGKVYSGEPELSGNAPSRAGSLESALFTTRKLGNLYRRHSMTDYP